VRGRPLLGAVAGFFFGVFLAYDLILFEVVVSDNPVVVVLPVVFLLAGVALGLWAPLARRR
jgi:hypothetical protein